ncbi:hypothetical protein QBC39DRAFT_343568 [Podospora conica]|nr:hypothetical protein QBC39DRAFT_343568 [Schizothecium conicum]
MSPPEVHQEATGGLKYLPLRRPPSLNPTLLDEPRETADVAVGSATQCSTSPSEHESDADSDLESSTWSGTGSPSSWPPVTVSADMAAHPTLEALKRLIMRANIRDIVKAVSIQLSPQAPDATVGSPHLGDPMFELHTIPASHARVHDAWDDDEPAMTHSAMGPLPPYASAADFYSMEKGAIRKLAEPRAEAEQPPTKDGYYHGYGLGRSEIVEPYSSSGPSQSNSLPSNLQTSNGNGQQNSKRKKSNSSGQDRDDSDNEDEEGRKSTRFKVPKLGEALKPLRLACPFYRHDPAKYGSSRSCLGPGWQTVHRVKEHIYRRHAMPIHCNRCRAIFETDQCLSDHMRVLSKSDICELNANALLDGFTPDQGKAMRCRKTGRGLAEEQKWCDLYVLLFPDCDPGNLPEPYHTNDEPAQELLRYRRFVEREATRHVRARLESNDSLLRVQGLPQQTRLELLQQLGDLVRDVHLDLFQGYRAFRETEAQGPASPATTSSRSINAADPEAPTAEAGGFITAPRPSPAGLPSNLNHINVHSAQGSQSNEFRMITSTISGDAELSNLLIGPELWDEVEGLAWEEDAADFFGEAGTSFDSLEPLATPQAQYRTDLGWFEDERQGC